MKFGETTIPTPPKGFQTMFQLWLVRHNPDRKNAKYILESPRGHIFQDEIFHLDDNGGIHTIFKRQFITFPNQARWEKMISDHMDWFNQKKRTPPYLPLDESSIALEIPDFNYVGIRWIVFSAPKIILHGLAKNRYSDDDKRAFIALFAHFHPERFSLLQALATQLDDLAQLCESEIARLEQEEQAK